MNPRHTAVVAAVIALTVVAIRWPLLDLPLERDEGEYAYIGWRLAHGEIPYRDWFDQKPPGAPLVYRLALAAPVDPVVGFRLLATLFSVVSAVALYFMGLRLLDPAAAALGAVLLCVLSANPAVQGPIANTEIFMLTGILVAHSLFLREAAAARASWLRCLGVGAALGMATVFKQVAAVNAPFLVLMLPFLVGGAGRWRRLAVFAAWAGVGGVLVWGGLALWFHAHGGLHAALDALFLHNLDYVSVMPLSHRLGYLAKFGGSVMRGQGIAWALAVLGIVALVRRPERGPALYISGWFVFSAIGVSASGYYFPHYFQQLLPVVALGAGAGAAAVARRLPGSILLRTTTVGGLALLQPLLTTVPFWRMPPDQAMRRLYPDQFFEGSPLLARELASITGADEPVFVFGNEPQILFYARRISATRYIHLFPQFGPFSDARGRQQALIDELEATPPAAIVWVPHAIHNASVAPRLLPAWLKAYTRKHYRLYARAVEADGAWKIVRAREGPEANVRAHLFVRVDPGRSD